MPVVQQNPFSSAYAAWPNSQAHSPVPAHLPDPAGWRPSQCLGRMLWAEAGLMGVYATSSQSRLGTSEDARQGGHFLTEQYASGAPSTGVSVEEILQRLGPTVSGWLPAPTKHGNFEHVSGAPERAVVGAGRSTTRANEIRWLREHREAYAGQWVALDGDRLIASGADAKEVFAAARRSGVARPLIVQVESGHELPFSGW